MIAQEVGEASCRRNKCDVQLSNGEKSAFRGGKVASPSGILALFPLDRIATFRLVCAVAAMQGFL
jgi:hypothetical protein